MKTQVFRIAVFTMALLAALAAMAQGPSGNVLVTIPFEFVIDGHHMQPGRYVVSKAANGVLLIHDMDVADNRMFLSVHTIESRAPKDAKLVFHRYGDTYFLAEVWSGNNNTIGRELIKSKAEKEILSGRLNGPRPKDEVAEVLPER